MIHHKKVWKEFFADVASGKKPFEVRVEQPNETPYAEGDSLFLQEFDKDTETYTGESTFKEITYVLRDSRFLPVGIVVLGLRPEERR